MNNFEKIRNMDIDEMVDYFENNCFDIIDIVLGSTEEIKQWLLEEVE